MKKKTRRSNTDEFKDEAVRLVKEQGYNKFQKPPGIWEIKIAFSGGGLKSDYLTKAAHQPVLLSYKPNSSV